MSRLSCLVCAVLASPSLVLAQSSDPAAVVPFTIRVPDAVLEDLDERLARTRFPGEIPGQGWARGTPVDYLKALTTYWRDQFDWRAQERRLNGFEQFTTVVDGVNMHFIHQRSRHPGALPLLLTHGWPGSIVEFEKIIGPLTDPTAHGGRAEDAFHVVAPSLPGFGFSGHPTEPGWGPPRMAGALAQLMARLGYDQYGAQGGDWGAIINTQLALARPEHLVGLHLNFCTGGGAAPEGLPQAELDRIRQRQVERADDGAYSQIQGTRPQTLGYGLTDSPAGTAAWIVEKFFTWSDVKASPEEKFTKDELLTNITLYWAMGTQTSSAQIYYENSHDSGARLTGRVEVPTACAVFPKEIFYAPRRALENRYNLVRWTEMPRGGHFAAMEEPELLVEDIRAFFRMLR
jgi:pimeloyl-ACP methyl ester carboxylesterase